MVKSHDVHVDSDYIKWVAELKQRYRSAQVKAAIRVNAEKLQFNWLLGRDLVRKKAEERWGTGVVEQLSLDLQRIPRCGRIFRIKSLVYEKMVLLLYAKRKTPTARWRIREV